MSPTLFDAVDEVRRRTAEAVIARSGINHPGLVAEIRRRFASEDPAIGGVMHELVLEAAPPYLPAETTMHELAGNLLSEAMVEALDGGADTRQRMYRFRRHWRPYSHQLEAWRALKEEAPRSVLVTSGTGSGKTECFLVPILDDLVRQTTETRLEGVQAIALYPLNALIASQEERLREWTAPFAPRVRFALYNRLLREEEPSSVARQSPEKVVDRKTLRAAPPPILVTNVTMLEYILLRKADAPIIERSQGKLKYIVLDEAHSYVGAQAAEIALLLRRVCLAFGVAPADVRFIATSATIGGPDAGASLEEFLCKVSGASRDRVQVIVGETRKPDLPPLGTGGRLEAEFLAAADPAGLFDALAPHPGVRPLLEALDAGPTPLSFIEAQARRIGVSGAVLASGIGAAARGDDALGPLRMHAFHRTVPGLWTCLDPACSQARPQDWPFGALATFDERLCACGAPAFEVVSCSECGEPFVEVSEQGDGTLVQVARSGAADDFAADADMDTAVGEPDEPEDTETDDTTLAAAPNVHRLLATRGLERALALEVDPRSGKVADRSGLAGHVRLFAHDAGFGCPACGAVARAGSPPPVRPFRFGAPFILSTATPALLDAAAPVERTQESGMAPPPSGGRQLLTFTDSRQGTARFAAKLQIGAERDFVRSFVYHAVQDSRRSTAPDAPALTELRNNIAVLEQANNPAFAGLLATLKGQEREALEGSRGGLAWQQMVARLAERPEVNTWLRMVWGPRDPARFETPEILANFLLLREFMRRPRRANALETLGLARLTSPVIQALPAGRLPSAFTGVGGGLDDWKAFLEIVLTWMVRANGAVRVDGFDRHWIQPKGPARSYVRGAAGQPLSNGELRWPSPSSPRPARPVILLAQAFDLALDDGGAREIIAECLDAVWTALLPVLSGPAATSAALNFESLAVAPVSEAWLCPVTRRLCDTTLRGLTPYGADRKGHAGVAAERLTMPVLPLPFLGALHGRDPAEARAEIAVWLVSDPAVVALRARGTWGDIADRIALFSDYFRSAEHSAQQPPARLRRYERQFRDGEINVLNCSTTMEMGVDIGSVSEVLMTNVPPSIANYRQRVGRAGRRQQPLSLGFTLCKDRPLDRDTFNNPVSYLKRQVRAPGVALDSHVVVQRHVNALMFETFTRQHDADAVKLQAGPFFGCPSGAGAGETPDYSALRMIEWMRRPSTEQSLAAAMGRLTAGSALQDDLGVIEEAARGLERVRQAFAEEWKALQMVLAERNPNDRAATRGLEIQVKRLCEDFLLSALSGRGFLPSHGFPTGVVPFVTPGEARTDLGAEEGNQFKSYPTRSRDVAIREYAPGAMVVLDGLVYKSAGVTLNWKRPASAEDVERDIQNLMQRWICHACGEAETTRHGLRDGACPACGAQGVQLLKVLEPAGFRSDIRQRPHADTDTVTYVPSEPPHVSARGADWSPFLDPALGRTRGSREGRVFFCTAGPGGVGYDVCLQCGRARPAEAARADEAAGPHWEHPPLIGKADIDGFCAGSTRPFAVQPGLRLAHEITTDVFELQAIDLRTGGAALAFGSALREALARQLGVEPDEMGVGASLRARPAGGRNVSVFLFDRASGGAGFAVQAGQRLPDLMGEVTDILDCRAPGCVNGCPACVVTGDMTDAEVASLDRQGALAAAQALAAEARPTDEDMAAPDARLVANLIDELRAAALDGARRLRLYGDGNLEVTSLLQLAPQLDPVRARGGRLEICLPQGTVAAMDGAARLAVRDVLSRLDAQLFEGAEAQFPNGARLLAEARHEGGAGVCFATRDVAAFGFGADWGRPERCALVRFTSSGDHRQGRLVPREELRPPVGAVLRELSHELDGPLSAFGQRAGKLIRQVLAEAGVAPDAPVQTIAYEDRYLRSPLTLKMCVDTLSALAPQGARQAVRISTTRLSADEIPPRRLHHDWRRDDDRADVASIYGNARNLAVSFHEGSRDHARRLILEFADGRRATLLLDQGFGAWHCERPRDFDFRADPTVQSRQLRAIEAPLVLAGARTWVVCTVGPG